MTDHDHSKSSRAVTFKITAGGGLVRCATEATSDLAIRVTGVPDDVRDAAVMVAVRKVVLLPTGGPWMVPWDRLVDARQGSILRDCR